MARNFIKNGFSVYVWNRTKEKVSDLISVGAIWADTPKIAVTSADIVFEVTANDESSKLVWQGKDGILDSARQDHYLITSATLSASWTDELALICSQSKLQFFDMPLTGGRVGAETGQLIMLAGGDKDKLGILANICKAISKKIIYFGRTGSGMRYKLILNMLQAVHIVGLGEALKIAKENDMDIETVGNALSERPGGITTQLAWEGYKTSAKNLTFAIKWLLKDLNYTKKLKNNIDTPIFDEVIQKYTEAFQNGKGDADWTAVNVE